MSAIELPRIVTTPDFCGGEARLDGTRIPIWLLVLHQRSGMVPEAILGNYPSLAPADLDAAWEYYRHHSLEIDRAIWWQDTAGNIPEGGPIPAEVIVEGIRLGLDEAKLREAFDPPLTEGQIAAAWSDYRSVPRTSYAEHSRAG